MSDDRIFWGALAPLDVFPSVGETDALPQGRYLLSNKISYLAENKVGFFSKSLIRLEKCGPRTPP